MFNIRECRDLLDMTQEEFAKLIGVTSTYVSQMERGKRSPSKTIVKIIETELQKLGKTASASVSVRDNSAPVAIQSPHANTAQALDIERLLAIIESQQATIASLIERLGK